MPFTIIRNDITKMNTDAIVNAANNRLLPGGGVCGAIFAAAGYSSLENECSKIGFCDTGNAVITPGFNLNAGHIIHTVGPVYSPGNPEQAQQLYNCYKSSLQLAKKNNLSSIAFPLISSGIYGYPKTEALEIARRAVADFLKDNDMDIYLVVYDKASFEISSELFNNVQSYIDEKLIVPDSRRMAYASASFSISAVEDCVRINAPQPEKYELENLKSMLENTDETFSEMLLRLIDERNLKDPDVYKKANIDRKLFSKIRNDINYHPKKNTVLSFAIALELSLDETEDLLNKAGFSLTHSLKSDIIIEYFIVNKCYDVLKINEVLFSFDQPLLSA